MSSKQKQAVFDYSVIVILAVLHAFEYILFIIGNKFAPAGVSGIATMIQYKLGISIGYVFLIANIPLCLFAYFKADKSYAIKTMVFCTVYSVSYLILQRFDFSFIQYIADTDTIFPCLIAGMMSGLIYGISFKLNSSTGGTDIIAKFLSTKKPTLNFFWVTFLLNAVIAFASIFVYADGGSLNYKPAALCIFYCFVSSYVGNLILKGSKQAYKFIVITNHAAEINAEIIEKLQHSATILDGKGGYSRSEREVIICVINKHQVVDFENILKKYDDTFAIIETVNTTYGKFRYVK